MKLISIVGARPNFMKIAPFIHSINEYNKLITQNSEFIIHKLVHTGQHYDDRMSKAFFEELNIPAADINLGIGSGTHAEQVGNTMIAFEKVLIKEKPDWIIVVGDVNATLACSVTAKKLHIKVCHIEAGLRSGDEKMPEEINRLVTDRLSDLLLTPDKFSIENLKKEGTPDNKIEFVGNIMIDTLEANKDKSSKLKISNIIYSNLLIGNSYKIRDASLDFNNHHNPNLPPLGGLEGGDYALMTMHRPSNVDTKEVLVPLFSFLTDEVAKDMPLLWAIHPRSQKMLKEFGLWGKAMQTENLILLHPLGYHEMLRLNMDAKIMLTDSGGLQEECCVLGTPCLTLRWNTERPITLRKHGGASVLVGNNVEKIRKEYLDTINFQRSPLRPELWDGKTAVRCLQSILNYNN